jgi:hypothetical protein
VVGYAPIDRAASAARRYFFGISLKRYASPRLCARRAKPVRDNRSGEAAREDRLGEEVGGIVGPEPAHLGTGLQYGVDEMASLASDLADIDVEDWSVGAEANRADGPRLKRTSCIAFGKSAATSRPAVTFSVSSMIGSAV